VRSTIPDRPLRQDDPGAATWVDVVLSWLCLAAVLGGAVLAAGALSAVPDAGRMWPWALARASGLVAYLLCCALVAVGIWQSHPWSRRWTPLRKPVLLRLHVLLTVFALLFVAAHGVALALDPYAHVGVAGALIPGRSGYRPLAVSVGIVAAYAGALMAGTAALGPRLGRRYWLPVHRLAALVAAGVWFHGVLAGSDTPALRAFYAATGGALLLLALSRYAAAPGRSGAAVADGDPAPEEAAAAGGTLVGLAWDGWPALREPGPVPVRGGTRRPG
jgi:DMSO/TMAO reductase YedYZ heme-binding membrane subunit